MKKRISKECIKQKENVKKSPEKKEKSSSKISSKQKDKTTKVKSNSNNKNSQSLTDKINKEDIKKIKEQYQNKSENEILSELKSLSSKIPQKNDIFDKLRPFLNEKQKCKLDKIINELNK